MFSQLKACRPGLPRKGTSIARAARPLGFAAVAVAVAVTVAGCKPGSITSASPGGSQRAGSTATGSSMSALSLAARQSQQIRSFTASLEIQASGALNATLIGTLKEATTPSPLISVRARAGALGSIRLILADGMVYLKSPLLAGMYHKPWVQGPATAMGGMSGVSLGPLLGLLQTSSPAVQLPLFSQGMNVRQMGSMSSGMTEFGGHYLLSSAMHSVAAGLQPGMQSVMNSGLNMTRFRVWMGHGHMVRKLVLIVLGQARADRDHTGDHLGQPAGAHPAAAGRADLHPGRRHADAEHDADHDAALGPADHQHDAGAGANQHRAGDGRHTHAGPEQRAYALVSCPW